MTRFAPCPACKRHVATREIACPFCAHRFTPRAQHVALVGRVTRAAVFSAALAACSKDKAPPAPAPPPAQGSDDLEQMLEPSGSAAVAPPAPSPSDAAVPEPDAAFVVDAGVPDAGVVIKKKKKQREQVEETVKVPIDTRHLAKPYGAPPARRRVV